MFLGSPGTNWRKQPLTQDGPNVTMEFDVDSMQMEFFLEDADDPTEELEVQSSDQPFQVFGDDQWEEPGKNEESLPKEPTSAKASMITTPNNDQASAPQKKKRNYPARDNVKKKKLSPSTWKKSVRKANFNAGIEHVTSRGKIKQARQIGKACDPKCKRCERRLTRDEEEEIFNRFWELESIQRKREFIAWHVDVEDAKTCSTSPENAKKRRVYFMSLLSEEESLRVCKTRFLSVLGIPDCWIETALNKGSKGAGQSPDKRGKHDNRPSRYPEEVTQSVRDHINMFPRIHSHYTRERSKREYVEEDLSVERMYALYFEWRTGKKYRPKGPNKKTGENDNLQDIDEGSDIIDLECDDEENGAKTDSKRLASLSHYRNIFNTEFNIGRFIPKKDQCEICNRWKFAKDQEERRTMVQEYAAHLKSKKLLKKIRDADKASASAEKCVACFDLQKVLTCPKSETSVFYYLSKLNLYNLTVFDLALLEGHCYLWTEVDGKKGPNEVGTCLWKFMGLKVLQGINEFSFCSDSPTGQNRNRMIFSLWLYGAVYYKVKITHRFLQSGHSYSEVDSMHARIETESQHKHIYTPQQWQNLILQAKKSGEDYKVTFLKTDDIMNLHFFVDQESWDKDDMNRQIYWSRVSDTLCIQ